MATNRVPVAAYSFRMAQIIRDDEIENNREIPNEIVLSRQHNDANVLSLEARFLSMSEAKDAVELWL